MRGMYLLIGQEIGTQYHELCIIILILVSPKMHPTNSLYLIC